MSSLFFKISFTDRIETYQRLRRLAKKKNLYIRVKNGGTRTVPSFAFYLWSRTQKTRIFYDLDKLAAAIEEPVVAQ